MRNKQPFFEKSLNLLRNKQPFLEKFLISLRNKQAFPRSPHVMSEVPLYAQGPMEALGREGLFLMSEVPPLGGRSSNAPLGENWNPPLR